MKKKIALITDVHANVEALQAVLLDMKDKNIDTIYSLGDIIGLGYAPSETIRLAIDNNIINNIHTFFDILKFLHLFFYRFILFSASIIKSTK